MATADQNAAEKIGRELDIQVRRLSEERAALQQAMTRIQEIDAELAILQVEQARINPRRPVASVVAAPVAVAEQIEVG